MAVIATAHYPENAGEFIRSSWVLTATAAGRGRPHTPGGNYAHGIWQARGLRW